MNEIVVSAANITKTYSSDLGAKPKQALRGLTFRVRRGEALGIVGPNGAGKSTALKILMGFVSQDQGDIQLNGLPPTTHKCRKNLGYLPEHPCLYKNLTVYDHLLFAAKIHRIPSSIAKNRINHLLERVKLSQSAKTPVRKFSKGMTQRAALAYALLHEPSLLILDEPMSGLDPVGRQLVIDIIREYKDRGTTILFCSHILTDVERICDRISVMNHGKIAATITPEDLQKAPLSQNNTTQSPLESFFFQTIKD